MLGGTYYEFFAGGGMARAGLGTKWECLLANDINPLKGETYVANWGKKSFILDDINSITPDLIPGQADLAWASFPCQDLSIAGNGLGIGREAATLRTRSGAFWAFVDVIRRFKQELRPPKVIVLENVPGLLSSNAGQDFCALICALSDLGYRYGAVIIDAAHFIPQSRPRVFIVAVKQAESVPVEMVIDEPDTLWHGDKIVKSYGLLSQHLKEKWIWWNLGVPPVRRAVFADFVDESGPGISWHTAEETNRLIGLMAPPHRKRVNEAACLGGRQVGSLSLRMRPVNGLNVQRAEVNFLPISGCLRTPKGGGSRARVIVLKGDLIKTRLLSPKEAARLMGLSESYVLPVGYEQAFQVIGDGLAVPVVRFLRDRILEPLCFGNIAQAA